MREHESVVEYRDSYAEVGKMVLTEIQTLNSVQGFVLLRGKGHQDCSGTISDKFYTAPSSHKKNKQYQCDISVTRCFRWLLQVNLTAIHPLPKPHDPSHSSQYASEKHLFSTTTLRSTTA